LDAGCTVDTKDSDDMTPLHYASISGHSDVARMLINTGANINSVDRFGRNIINYPAKNNKLKTVCFLFDKGVSVDTMDRKKEDDTSALCCTL
jgi:ankyrin repeat protein